MRRLPEIFFTRRLKLRAELHSAMIDSRAALSASKVMRVDRNSLVSQPGSTGRDGGE
jgi:hypothetical protein